MKKMLILLVVVSVGLIYAEDSKAEYIGTNKCKMCHRKVEDGEQYAKWEQGPHAKSLETLKTDAAKAIAKKKGLKTAPDQSPECLVCHVTGWGTESGYSLNVDPMDKKAVRTNDNLASVGCEACHGAGSEYKSKKTMMEITAGTISGESVGLTTITAKTCTSCHNPDSPTYKPFDFASRVKEVAHPAPKK